MNDNARAVEPRRQGESPAKRESGAVDTSGRTVRGTVTVWSQSEAGPSGNLGFIEGPDRYACRRDLSKSVETKVVQSAGREIEWWANKVVVGGRERVRFDMLGEQAYVFSEPRLNDQAKGVSVIHKFDLVGGLRFSGEILWSPGTSSGGVPSDKRAVTEEKRDDRARYKQLGFNDVEADALAALPQDAKEFLLQPLQRRDEKRIASTVYYYGSATELSAYAFVVVTARSLRAVYGSRWTAAGRPEYEANWKLRSYAGQTGRRTS